MLAAPAPYELCDGWRIQLGVLGGRGYGRGRYKIISFLFSEKKKKRLLVERRGCEDIIFFVNFNFSSNVLFGGFLASNDCGSFLFPSVSTIGDSLGGGGSYNIQNIS